MIFSARVKWLTVILILAMFIAALVSLLVGSVEISPGEVLRCCWAALQGRISNDPIDRILLSTRLPRVILAAAVGAALAMAGLSAQTLFRNPLASPYIVGVSGGSAVGAVAAMLLIGQAAKITFAAVPVFSVVGGLTVTAIVFLLGRRGRNVGHSLLLAGIAIGALCSSITAAALYLAGERLQILVFWLMGGLWRANWQEVLLMAPVSAAGLIALIILAPAMNVALVGERSAQDLGVNIGKLQKLLLVLIGVETALAVSLTGVIGFVGLIVPHLLRLAVGSDHRRLVPVTAIGGALLLIVADTLARTLASPVEIPVGILTAVVGAPIFLWLLQRRDTRGAIA
ncbi:MAG: iron ABC transporter permease [Planctomycetota bacterium]